MKYTNILMSLVLLLSLAGCVIDDIPGNCPGHGVEPDPKPDPDPTDEEYTIYFQYTGDGTNDLFEEKFEKVNLYVFNETGTSVLSREIPEASLGSGHGISVTLPVGKMYTAVCIGNALQYTTTCSIDGRRPDEIFFSHPAYQTGEGPITTNDRNYYGTTALTSGKDNTVVFHSAHIKVCVEVLGYHGYLERNGIADNGPMVLCMGNLSPRMFFDGSLCPSRADYYPEVRLETGRKDCYISYFNILRLDGAHPAELRLCTSGDEEVYIVDISSFLADNPGVDLTKEEAELPVRIDLRGKDVEVSVTVPDWDIEDTETDPDWGPW